MQSKRITKALSFVLSLCFLCCALFGSSVTAQPTTVAYASSKTDRLKSKKQKIDEVLGLNSNTEKVSVTLALGYRAEDDVFQKMKKVRKPDDKLFKFI